MRLGEALVRARRGVLVSRNRPTAVAVPDHTGAAVVGPLVYELLDAHADTADLATDLRWDPRWAAHLDYLRDLQRTAREALAHLSPDDVA